VPTVLIERQMHTKHRTPGMRWEREGLRRDAGRRDLAPDMMRIRGQTVDHPFGTIKGWMGATHFLRARSNG